MFLRLKDAKLNVAALLESMKRMTTYEPPPGLLPNGKLNDQSFEPGACTRRPTAIGAAQKMSGKQYV